MYVIRHPDDEGYLERITPRNLKGEQFAWWTQDLDEAQQFRAPDEADRFLDEGKDKGLLPEGTRTEQIYLMPTYQSASKEVIPFNKLEIGKQYNACCLSFTASKGDTPFLIEGKAYMSITLKGKNANGSTEVDAPAKWLMRAGTTREIEGGSDIETLTLPASTLFFDLSLDGQEIEDEAVGYMDTIWASWTLEVQS